jgi:hypothetical protein
MEAVEDTHEHQLPTQVQALLVKGTVSRRMGTYLPVISLGKDL